MKFLWQVAFLFFSCFIYPVDAKKDDSYRDTMEIINEYSKKLYDEKKIVLRSYGLHYAGSDKVYDGKIHYIALGYSVDKHIQYDEAKQLFYEIIDGLLNAIKQKEHLAQYFYNNPVSYEDLDVSLSFNYDDKISLKKGDIDMAYIYQNLVKFFVIEIEEPAEMKKEAISADVSIVNMDDFFSKIRIFQEDPVKRIKIEKKRRINHKK